LDIGSASALTLENVAIGRTINILKPKIELIYSQIYASYYINQRLKKRIASLAKGVSISNVYNSDLKTLEIILPSLFEQQKIATFLSAVDKKIQQLTRKKALLEDYKKGVMQKLFPSAGSGQAPEIRFKDDNGEEFPEWEEKRINQLSIFNPKIKKLPTEFIYIDLESVDNGRLNAQNRVMFSEAPSRAQRLLSRKDVLVQTVRPYQMNNYYFDKEGVFVASTGYAQLRVMADAHPLFIYYLVHSFNVVKRIIRRSAGSNYPAITSSDLGKIKAFVPSSFREQQKVGTFLGPIDSKINSMMKEIMFVKKFKKGLLQQMFV
jgi:type I restriction enzyme, S subunit